jgi:hypothetical protein
MRAAQPVSASIGDDHTSGSMLRVLHWIDGSESGMPAMGERLPGRSATPPVAVLERHGQGLATLRSAGERWLQLIVVVPLDQADSEEGAQRHGSAADFGALPVEQVV